MVLEQKVVEVYVNGFIRPSKSPASASRQAGKGLILSEDFLLADAGIGFHLQQCRHTVCREGAHLREFTQLQMSYLLICLSKSPTCPPSLQDYSSAKTVAFDYVSIPTTCPPREALAWTKVQDVQVFIQLLSTFHLEVENYRTTHFNAQDELINRHISLCGPDRGWV